MIRIAVVADFPTPTWTARQLILALESLGAAAIYLRPSEVIASIEGGTSRFLIAPTMSEIHIDGVLLRDLGTAVTIELLLRRADVFRQMELSRIPVVNPVDAFLRARDKYLSLVILSLNGIRVPPTYLLENADAASRIVSEMGEAVIKPIIGSRGMGSVKLSDPDIAYVVSRTLVQLRQPIYVQKYIRKPNRDIRVFVVGDRVIAAYYRVQTGDGWKTNIAQGAKPEPMKSVDKELEDIALKATKVLGLHYSGIDVAESDEGYVVLEVNASPNWAGLFRATGLNPAYHIAEYMLELVKK